MDSDHRSLEEVRAALGADFEVLRSLGRGSVATVCRATDRALGVPVAITVLRPGKAADETARRRFEREARAAASLSDHPNTVAVTRFGRLPDETPYLVMPYVQGRTMEERLAAEGQLSVGEATQILKEVASALALAHDKLDAAVFVAYEVSDFTERAVAKGLAGEIPIGGRLPITIPGLFEFGHGLAR